MAKYVAIFVSLIFFVISVNSAVLEPSADIIRSEDAEEGKYYQRVKDVKDKVDKEGEFVPTKDTLPIYPVQSQDNNDLQCPDPTPVRGTIKVLHGHPFSYGCNVLLTCDPGLVFNDGKSVWNLTCLGLPVQPPTCVWAPVHEGKPICQEPEQIEKQQTDLVDNTDDTETKVEKQTIVARDVNEPVAVNSSLTDEGTKVNNEETKNYVSTLDIDSYGPEEDLDGTYHDNIITNRNNDEITEKDDALNDASQNEVNGENTNKLDEYKSYKSDIEIYDDIVNHFASKDYEVDFSEKNDFEAPEESSNSETDYDTEHTTSSEKTSESFENENIVQKTMEEQKSKPETLSNENDYAHAFPEVENDADEKDLEVEIHEDEPLHEMTDNTDEVVQEGLQEESEENNEEIEQTSEDEEENETEDNEMKNEDIEDTVEEQEEEEREEENEEETEDESEVETEKSEDYEEEQQREYDNQIIENSEEENDNEEDHVEVQSNNDEMEDETEEEAERDEPGEDETEHEGQNMEELENDEEYEADTEDTNVVENIESEIEDESEEENNEDERDIVGDVYPLNPPSIKEHNIIYAALKESSMFDKEEEEDNEEEEENDVNDGNLVYGEVEPPGSLDDVQMFPFQASKEQIQTNENDCSLPAETGPCRAYHKRFFYNSNTRECDVFVYGGCEGNANSFKTLDDCVNTCVKNSLNL
ncbi:bromo and FHA domain-containing protein DDB_G0267958-like isoform X3 [Ruditapes philippinarum]|uniref:bromo and FHA domain-containing protein DDB_G0267958-like isoform X3 n=1 Tax=Ruditapes philippinarum TaxID=129788 RepID=UPI00295C03BF|nr:bromo and FHA domain-containing protein DDB_G0267958-like isoform X3 [Ruditapes philippinarum]